MELRLIEVEVMAKVANIGWGNANGVAVDKTVRPNPTGSRSDNPTPSRAVPIGRSVSPRDYQKMKEAAKHGGPLNSKTQRDT